ncbi:AMP-binding protein [Paenibacillus sp. PL91]|uniref:AMP-binding protein n=1 Tax=Paenibacillus sp. PL91 TaxID=2729538 RepID=UPI00145E7B0E|nr:AMP-binding protein [Paenibacillus sp. PL91]MBC9202356.1 AMP-binding protein [Paenibacillus sp. PL91]
MLQFNRDEMSISELETRWRSYKQTPHLQNPLGKRYALCFNDSSELVPLVLYLKEIGGSVLLMHGSTPFHTAKSTADAAGCHGLLFHEYGQYFPNLELQASVEKEPKVYQFSSGTTGNAKLIGRSWAAIDKEISSYNEAVSLEAGCTPIVIAPVSHSYGLICGVLASLARGSKPVIVSNANPKLAIGLIRDFPNHIVYGVPVQLQALASLNQSQAKLHKLMSSGVPMSVQLFEQLSHTGVTLMQQYGCSEAGCISVSTSMQSHHDLGLPLSKWNVFADSSRIGELMPAELVASSADQIVRTGDLGIVNKDGSLAFVSRIDDVINVAGLKVYPLEVEEVISSMPGIKEIVIYRGSHPISGDKVRGMAIADEGLLPEAVREWCLQRLPAYKVPLEISFVNEIPKSATGKISRRQLELGEVVQ